METVLYFQSPSKNSAPDKIRGVRRYAAIANWHIQVLDEFPSSKSVLELYEFWNPVGSIIDIMIMDRIALILTIIGALNWGSIGLFKFDIVAWLCGGQTALVSRIIYTVVALAGIWCISLLFRARERFESLDE